MDQLHDSNAQLTVDGANGGNPISKEDDNTGYITFDKTGNHYELADDGTVNAAGERWQQNQDGSYTKGEVTVKVGGLSIEWANGADICPDELYYNSVAYNA